MSEAKDLSGTSELYSRDFYASQAAGSRSSAEAVLPFLFAEIGPIESLVDVGGGVGTWAGVAQSLGVETVRVIDGAWVESSQMQVSEECFTSMDLETANLSSIGRFDLAICLEAAEHLSPERGESLVADLCSLSDTVFFSAAVPGQGGTNHINERWLSYWKALFATQGYGMSDPLRPKVWSNPEVDWWYAQNAVLFRKGENLDYSGLVDVVHPRAWDGRTRAYNPLRSLARRLPKPVKSTIKRIVLRDHTS